MEKENSLFNELFRKVVFILLWLFTIVLIATMPLIGLGFIIVIAIISKVLSHNKRKVKNLEDLFTKEELKKLEANEKISNEEYFELLVEYQSRICPVKVDPITTWTSSEVTQESYIYNYEINDRWHRYGEIDMEVVKKNILASIDKNSNHAKRILATNRIVIFRYKNRQKKTIEDVVLSKDDLMN